jgi:hypothetical protein
MHTRRNACLAFSILILTLIGNATARDKAGANQADAVYLRPADSEEIFGVWQAQAPQASHYRFKYVVIDRNGRIGSVVTDIRPTNVNATTISDAIQKKEIANGVVTGWQPCKVKDGELTIAPGDKAIEQYFSVKAISPFGDEADKSPIAINGMPGDLVMQLFYRAPSGWIAKFPARTPAPAPWVLTRLSN